MENETPEGGRAAAGGENFAPASAPLDDRELFEILGAMVGGEAAAELQAAARGQALHRESMEGAVGRMREAAEAANLELPEDDQLQWVLTRAGCQCLLPAIRRPDGKWAVHREELAEAIDAAQAQRIADDLSAAATALGDLAQSLREAEGAPPA